MISMSFMWGLGLHAADEEPTRYEEDLCIRKKLLFEEVLDDSLPRAGYVSARIPQMENSIIAGLGS